MYYQMVVFDLDGFLMTVIGVIYDILRVKDLSFIMCLRRHTYHPFLARPGGRNRRGRKIDCVPRNLGDYERISEEVLHP